MYGIVPATHGNPSDFPLLSSKIHYDLIDVQSLATLVLTYASNASEAADVNYVCPLPSDASVCSFKAVIDGTRTIKGVVKEKAKAKAEYDEGVAQGKTAALLQQNNVEVFQVSLGNIRPKQVIDIYISYASLITGNGELDSLRLTFPSVIAPRYGPPPNELLSLVSRIHPIKTALEFSVSVQMTSHIKSITSPSHPISMTLGASKIDSGDDFDPFKAYVTLTSSDHLDKDVVVIITCQGLDKPRCTVESFSLEEGAQEFTDAYSLTLVPRFDLPPLQKQEYIFLVDRSGSMRGQKMTAVRSALQIMLRSLPSANTSFNIFSFGSHHNSLWRSSVAYGAESLKTAASHVDKMSADYGGTEIRSALDTVLRTHVDNQDTPLTVFVLTDGEAYDLNGVQSTVSQYVDQYKDKANFLRVFCMGIGNSVSRAMCDMIARAGQGAVVYVGEDEKPDKKLITLLRAARGPIITNVSVDWGVVASEEKDDDFEMILPQPKPEAPLSLFDEKVIPKDDVSLGPQAVNLPPPPTVQQAPTNASLLTLYPGFRTSLFAIIKRDKGGDSAPGKSVRVKGVVQGRAVELEVPVTAAMAPEAFTQEQDCIKILHVLAARALVQRFEDEGKKAGIMSDTLKTEVLRVAERYGITSSETSFVAVDQEGTPVVAVAVADESKKVQYTGAAARYMPFHLHSATSAPISRPRPRFLMEPARSAAPASARELSDSVSNSFSGPNSLPPAPSGASVFSASRSVPSHDQEGTPVVTVAVADQPKKVQNIVGGLAPGRALVSSSAPLASATPATPGAFVKSKKLRGRSAISHNRKAGIARRPRTDLDSVSDPFSNLHSLPSVSTTGFASVPSSAPVNLFAMSAESHTQSSGVSTPGMSQPVVASPQIFRIQRRGRPILKDNEYSAKNSEDLQPTIESIARYQTFEGSFDGSPSLFKLLVKQDTLPPLPDTLKPLGNTGIKIWCSILCLVFMQKKFPDDHSVWELMVEKGDGWVSDTLAESFGEGNVSALVDVLKKEAGNYIV